MEENIGKCEWARVQSRPKVNGDDNRRREPDVAKKPRQLVQNGEMPLEKGEYRLNTKFYQSVSRLSFSYLLLN